MLSGRKELTKREIEALRKLFEKHTPVRIQKCIDEAAERFKRMGRNMRELTFNYIWASLKNQKSFEKFQANSHKKSVKVKELQKKHENTKPIKVKHIQEPSESKINLDSNLSIEEAEKIIAEGLPEQTHDPLLDKIKAKQDALEEKMSILDYLKLKFPNENEEVLKNQSHFTLQGKNSLRDAFLADYICALCNGQGKCKNFFGPNQVRPTVDVIEYGPDKKRLKIKYGDRVECRFAKKKNQVNIEFENQLQKIGARPNQTFETYKASTPELKIAEASAILAARYKKSLILAGKQGTGKTHLATAIAVEAIKNGQSALIASTPEMLDELRQAACGDGDFYGLKRKYKDVSCLVLDDFGKQKSSDAGNDYLFQIIDHRYQNGKQTIITTNALTPEALCKPWDKDKILPLISRLLENGDCITIWTIVNKVDTKK